MYDDDWRMQSSTEETAAFCVSAFITYLIGFSLIEVNVSLLEDILFLVKVVSEP